MENKEARLRRQPETALRPRHVLLQTFVLSLISLLIGLGICEVLVRLFVPVRAVGPTVTIFHPYYGKALKRSFSAQRSSPEFMTRLTTNSLGFRGPEVGARSRRPLLFLGDSFTLGYGVNDGQEFPALVRQSLAARSPKAEIPVINAGLGHNGNGRAVKFLRTEGAQYNPALVVLQMHGNDFDDNLREKLFELTPAGELYEQPVPLPSRTRRLWEFVESIPVIGSGLSYSYLIGLLRQARWIHTAPEQAAASGSLPLPDQDLTLLKEQLTIRLLEEVLTICKRGGWPVLAVLIDLPVPRLVALEKVLHSHSVPVVVIPTRSERPDLYYKVDGHLNATGHLFTANQVLEAIGALNLE
jgi:hypothetical protein